MSYQENLVGNQMYIVFAMALLLVYLVLAGQYESWYRPLAVLFAVPIALLGPVAALTALHIDNNLYTQIGIVLLIALSAKNAILIVEFARELREGGKSIAEAAVEAARARFRPILMTSFAFILGVAAAGVRDRRRRQRPRLDRHRGVHRHARLDLHRDPVRAVVLRDRAALRGMAAFPQEEAGAGGARRVEAFRGHILVVLERLW